MRAVPVRAAPVLGSRSPARRPGRGEERRCGAEAPCGPGVPGAGP